jgi:hypothetical protein
MRHVIGVGTPRGLQSRVAAFLGTLLVLIRVVRRRLTAISSSQRLITAMRGWLLPLTPPCQLVTDRDLHHGLLSGGNVQCESTALWLTRALSSSHRNEARPTITIWSLECRRRFGAH